ncbi:MAG: hypothetical protein H7288_15115 [Kineosporiaceae bacterium]|nr:hypothetical protein [Aeromicrobium sp.]
MGPAGRLLVVEEVVTMVDPARQRGDIDLAQSALALRQSYIMSAPTAASATNRLECGSTTVVSPSSGILTSSAG